MWKNVKYVLSNNGYRWTAEDTRLVNALDNNNNKNKQRLAFGSGKSLQYVSGSVQAHLFWYLLVILCIVEMWNLTNADTAVTLNL